MRASDYLDQIRQLVPTTRFLYWIKERESIRLKKEAGQPKPWTEDPILRSYRFCNVRREDDKVTKWIAENWRDPHELDPDLWFAMVVARKINWPETLDEVGYPVPWSQDRFLRKMKQRKNRRQQLESGAYMITAGTGTEWVGKPKYEFLATQVFTPLWLIRKQMRPTTRDTLQSFHARLVNNGNTIASFIAGQVVADIKYVDPLRSASDWHTWAAIGPGSSRGLSRLYGPTKKTWNEKEWLNKVNELQSMIPIDLHAQDVQNCLCEFDKYERVLHGEGQPRSKYPGAV